MDTIFTFGAALCYGLEPTLAKIGFNDGTPLLVGLAIKSLTAAGGFLVYLYWKGALPARTVFAQESTYWYIGAGVANILFLGLYYGVPEVMRVNVVVPLVQTSPFFVVLLSYFTLPRLERVTLRLLVGTTCVIVGTVVIIGYA